MQQKIYFDPIPHEVAVDLLSFWKDIVAMGHKQKSQKLSPLQTRILWNVVSTLSVQCHRFHNTEPTHKTWCKDYATDRGAPEAQWVKSWPNYPVVPSSIPAGIYPFITWCSIATAIHHHLFIIILVWLQYCSKGHNITGHPSISAANDTSKVITYVSFLQVSIYTASLLVTKQHLTLFWLTKEHMHSCYYTFN